MVAHRVVLVSSSYLEDFDCTSKLQHMADQFDTPDDWARFLEDSHIQTPG